eukprot:scaffold13478_cov132-Cylindrotheca_fusiformis.AAC.29
MLHRPQYRVLCLVAVFTSFRETSVNARSTFLPFASNTWGALGPSPAPSSEPSPSKKTTIRRKKRRTKPQKMIDDDIGTSNRGDGEHTGKKKRKKKKRSSSPMLTDSKTNSRPKSSRKKEKRSRTTDVTEDPPKHSYKGSSFEATKELSNKPSRKRARRVDKKDLVVKTVEPANNVRPTKKRRRKKKITVESSTNGSKSQVSRDKMVDRKKKSKKRKPTIEAIPGASSVAMPENPQAKSRSKKSKRIKKHHRAARNVPDEEEATRKIIDVGSTVKGKQHDLQPGVITRTEPPLRESGLSASDSNICTTDSDQVVNDISAAPAVAISEKHNPHAVDSKEGEHESNEPPLQQADTSGKLFAESPLEILDGTQLESHNVTSHDQSVSSVETAEEGGTIQDSNDSLKSLRRNEEDTVEAKDNLIDRMVQSSEGSIAGEASRQHVSNDVLNDDENEIVDELPVGASGGAMASKKEFLQSNNESAMVTENERSVSDELVPSEIKLKSDSESSDLSETDDVEMEEYTPDLTEKGRWSNASGVGEESEPPVLGRNPQQNPSPSAEPKPNSNYAQHEGTPKESSSGNKVAKEVDQDMVDFIGDVLQEDVSSWINETSSDCDGSSDTLNGTRGGQQVSKADEINGSEGPEETGETKEPYNTDAVGDHGKSHSPVEVSNNASVGALPKNGKVAPSHDSEGVDHTEETLLERPNNGAVETKVDLDALESSEDCDTDIAVSVVTWNLAESSPSEDDAAFIRNFRNSGIRGGSGSDLVLISGQECENIKPRRSEGSRSREYRRLMIKMLGEQYVPVALHLLGGIQFGLFAKKSFLKEIEEIAVADVTCGIGNVFHNKGAIAAFLKVKARNQSQQTKAKSLRMVFVTAHMAAHVKNSDARDSDFWRISSELEAQAPEGFLPRRKEDSNEGAGNGSFLFDSVDRVFFCGDLNYRIDLPRELTEFTILNNDNGMIQKDKYPELLRHDQLQKTIAACTAFPGFAEGRIAFAPTFKFDKETGFYDTSHKQRIPAWTDRILFKPVGTRVLEYTSEPNARHSDHRPVHGTFRVSMEGRDVPQRPRSRKRKQRSTRSSDYSD